MRSGGQRQVMREMCTYIKEPLIIARRKEKPLARRLQQRVVAVEELTWDPTAPQPLKPRSHPLEQTNPPRPSSQLQPPSSKKAPNSINSSLRHLFRHVIQIKLFKSRTSGSRESSPYSDFRPRKGPLSWRLSGARPQILWRRRLHLCSFLHIHQRTHRRSCRQSKNRRSVSSIPQCGLELSSGLYQERHCGSRSERREVGRLAF